MDDFKCFIHVSEVSSLRKLKNHLPLSHTHRVAIRSKREMIFGTKKPDGSFIFFFRALEMVFWCPIHRQKGKNVSGEKKKGKNRIGTFLSTAGVPMTSAEVQTRPLTPFSSAAGGWWQVFRGVAVKVGGQVIMRTTLVVNSSSFLFGRKKKVLVKRTSYFSRFCIDAFRAIFFPKKNFNLI